MEKIVYLYRKMFSYLLLKMESFCPEIFQETGNNSSLKYLNDKFIKRMVIYGAIGIVIFLYDIYAQFFLKITDGLSISIIGLYILIFYISSIDFAITYKGFIPAYRKMYVFIPTGVIVGYISVASYYFWKIPVWTTILLVSISIIVPFIASAKFAISYGGSAGKMIIAYIATAGAIILAVIIFGYFFKNSGNLIIYLVWLGIAVGYIASIDLAISKPKFRFIIIAALIVFTAFILMSFNDG